MCTLFPDSCRGVVCKVVFLRTVTPVFNINILLYWLSFLFADITMNKSENIQSSCLSSSWYLCPTTISDHTYQANIYLRLALCGTDIPTSNYTRSDKDDVILCMCFELLSPAPRIRRRPESPVRLATCRPYGHGYFKSTATF
jgi:hypothetical protein